MKHVKLYNDDKHFRLYSNSNKSIYVSESIFIQLLDLGLVDDEFEYELDVPDVWFPDKNYKKIMDIISLNSDMNKYNL